MLLIVVIFIFSLANLDEAGCKQAMIEHVNSQCCYGKKPANEMTLQKAVGLTALHVSLVHSVCVFLLSFWGDGFQPIHFYEKKIDSFNNYPWLLWFLQTKKS